MFVWTQEVVIDYSERKIVAGVVIKKVCVMVRCFVGTVQLFDHLFDRTVFCRYSIVVDKSDDFGNRKVKSSPKLFENSIAARE